MNQPNVKKVFSSGKFLGEFEFLQGFDIRVSLDGWSPEGRMAGEDLTGSGVRTVFAGEDVTVLLRNCIR
jgi:hypothetical protein